MKVALVHDHLTQDGGAEKVLRALADIFPNAPIYTLLCDPEFDRVFSGRTIATSIIQKLPSGIKHYQWYLPLMPMAVEFFDLRAYDLVISDASAFAKGVITSPETLHICYCHTPTRYLWDYTHQYINELRFNRYFKKIISLTLNYVRLWDRQAADRPDLFLANSETVRRRIRKYYRREATVIYPPVNVRQFSPASGIGKYFLAGGRLAPYKRLDIVVEAFKKSDEPLVIYGSGVDEPRLKKMALGAKNIEFTGRVDDRRLAELYQNARAFLYPQEEDFGITAVESMAAGRPVIAYRRGGARETVLEGQTGIFFDEQTADGLAAAVVRFKSMAFNAAAIRAQAEKFSDANFRQAISAYIENAYARWQKNDLS